MLKTVSGWQELSSVLKQCVQYMVNTEDNETEKQQRMRCLEACAIRACLVFFFWC